MTTWMAFVSIPTPVATEFGACGPAHTCYFPLGELTTSFLPSHLAVLLCGFQNKRQTLVYSTTHPKLRSPPLCTPPAAVSTARAPQAFTEAELLRGPIPCLRGSVCGSLLSLPHVAQLTLPRFSKAPRRHLLREHCLPLGPVCARGTRCLSLALDPESVFYSYIFIISHRAE